MLLLSLLFLPLLQLLLHPKQCDHMAEEGAVISVVLKGSNHLLTLIKMTVKFPKNQTCNISSVKIMTLRGPMPTNADPLLWSRPPEPPFTKWDEAPKTLVKHRNR